MGFKELFDKGQYQDILDKIAELENQGNLARLSPEQQTMVLFYKSRALEQSGQFKDALAVAKTAREKLSSSIERYFDLALLSAQLYAMWRLGQLDEGLIASKEGTTIIDSLTEGELDAGAEWIANFYSIKGNIHVEKGDLNTGMDHFQQSLNLREKVGTISDIAISLNNIGGIYLFIGELGTALNYIQRSLAIYESLNDTKGIALTLIHIGYVHGIKGEPSLAEDYYRRSLALSEASGDVYHAHIARFYLILAAVEQQDQNKARKLLTRIKSDYDRYPSQVFSTAIDLAEALTLKLSKRMKDKMQAQAILAGIAGQKQVNFEITVQALTHLCELLLLELKTSGEPEVMIELKNYVNKLYSLAQDHNSFLLAGNALILKAKLASIESQLQQAFQFLDQVAMIAEEKKIGSLVQKATEERELLEAEYEKWQELIQQNAPLQERLEQARLEKYLEQAQKLASSLKI